MNYLRRYSQAALFVALVYGLAEPTAARAHKIKDPSRVVKPEKVWQGYAKDEDLLAKTPPPDFITDAKAFEAHWKAWKLGDKVPEVDFKNELVVMMARKRTVYTFMTAFVSDKDLVFAVTARESEGPGFGYVIISVKKEGIESAAGKRLDGKKVAAKPPPTPLKAEKTWSGTVMDLELLKKKGAPRDGCITDARAFEELWKAWNLGDKVPEVDFKREIVLVCANPRGRVTVNPHLDDKGNLSWYCTASLDNDVPGFGYMIISVKKDGVKKVNDVPLKE